MPKTRSQKEAIFEKTVQGLSDSQSVVLMNIQGVKVSDMESIRDALHEKGLSMQVAKNTILKKALGEVKQDVPADLLDQPIALVYSIDDAVAGPKTMSPLFKDIESLKLVGGIMEGKFLSVSEVEAVAKLPSREELLARLVGTLQAPLSGMVNVLQGNIRNLVFVLAQVRDQKTA